ncbi:MAG: YfiR family protein [Cyclobacteriaceae bacterium]|nr:YfiR family protein [Cyclobacteriaceae bacterium]
MKKLISTFLILQIATYTICAQGAGQQADIIFRISNHIAWPSGDLGYKFVIGVIGSEIDFLAMQQMAGQKKSIQNYPIEVRFFNCTDNIAECNVIYVSEECGLGIDKILKETKSAHVLVITSQPGYAALGSIINFVESEGKVSIELNEKQAIKRGLEVSAALKEIAVVIEPFDSATANKGNRT